MALSVGKVNEIWNALNEVSDLFDLAMQSKSFKTSAIAEFFVSETMKRGTWTREEVLEAWVLMLIETIFTAANVPKVPRSN